MKETGKDIVIGRRERRRKQLRNNIKETKTYWKLKAKELDRTVWRIRFGKEMWNE
jgi:hypothetical protein